MLYVPTISNYKPFYVQFATGSAVNITTTYSVIVKTHDYPMALKAKEPYKNQWKDQHGDEEYIGSDGLYFEAFTFKMDCVMLAKASSLDAAIADLKAGVVAFRNALSTGFFKTYDAWTGFGFQDVRLVEFPMPQNSDYGVFGKSARVIFSVTFKVNDPVTNLVLQNGQITTPTTQSTT